MWSNTLSPIQYCKYRYFPGIATKKISYKNLRICIVIDTRLDFIRAQLPRGSILKIYQTPTFFSASHICTERYTKQQFVRLFQDLVTIIEKRFVSLFDIIRKL